MEHCLNMEHSEIFIIFNLLKRANNEGFVTVSEMSKELGVKKIELMKYIDANPYLFDTSTELVEGKNRGMLITKIYEHIEDNPISASYAMKMAEEYADTIDVTPISEYGHIYGFYIKPSPETYDHQNVWRNTQAKIDKLINEGLIGTREFTFGLYSDMFTRKFDNVVLGCRYFGEVKELLHKHGWKVYYNPVN